MAKTPVKLPLTVVDPRPTIRPPPRKLGDPGLSLWNAIQSEYRIDDAGGVELLAQACGAVDRIEALAARIAVDGEVIDTTKGPKPHPALRDELAARSFVCRTLEPARSQPRGRQAEGPPARSEMEAPCRRIEPTLAARIAVD